MYSHSVISDSSESTALVRQDDLHAHADCLKLITAAEILSKHTCGSTRGYSQLLGLQPAQQARVSRGAELTPATETEMEVEID